MNRSKGETMIRHVRRALCACAITAAALAAPAVAQADVLNDWNVLAQNHAITLRPTAHGQTRGIAMVQGAVYDAVNAIDRGHQPYLLNVQALGVQPWASADAAIATAAHHVLVELVAPAQVAGLDAAYKATLDGVPDGLVEQDGVRAGEAAAAAMLAARGNDGYFDPFDLEPRDRPRPRRLEAVDTDSARSGRIGRGREAVPHREPLAVPLEGPQRAHEQEVREGLRRGEVARRA